MLTGSVFVLHMQPSVVFLVFEVFLLFILLRRTRFLNTSNLKYENQLDSINQDTTAALFGPAALR